MPTGRRHPRPAEPVDVRAHTGRWVAVLGTRVLVAADDPADIVAWLSAHDVRPDSVFRVPEHDEDAASAHGLA